MNTQKHFKDYEIFTKQLKNMPIFNQLVKDYSLEKPFINLNVIIAHVLVSNTLPLIATIKEGGANVTVIPSSPAINMDVITILKEVGCEVNLNYVSAKNFDYALDVGGIFSSDLPKYGVIEVTRSGVHKYISKKDKIIIISADDSTCKLIETFIGNPQSTLDGIKKFIGDPEIVLKGKTLAILGFGKIGRGISRLFRNYCNILVCDINPDILKKAVNLGFDTFQITKEKKRNFERVNEVDFVISCTGFANVVSNYFEKLFNPVLINLGNFDEFGEDYSAEEVFMSKDRPFNFNNEPPTANRYIDPILASEVEALNFIIKNKNKLENSLYPLPKEIDEKLVNLFLEFNKESISDIQKYF
jgi:S-adenosylhomocysteine hydrolase